MFDDEPFKSPFEAEVDRVANEAMAREAANELGDNPFAGMTEIVNFIDTNFEKDGKRISMIDLNGEVHYGYSDNVKINAVMGDTPQSNKIIAYIFDIKRYNLKLGNYLLNIFEVPLLP